MYTGFLNMHVETNMFQLWNIYLPRKHINATNEFFLWHLNANEVKCVLHINCIKCVYWVLHEEFTSYTQVEAPRLCLDELYTRSLAPRNLDDSSWLRFVA